MMFVYTLGTALIDAGDVHIAPNAGRKFALLLHLSAEAGRRVSRTTLNELMFPDQPHKNARHSLRELVYECRQLGVRIESDADGLQLAAEDSQTDHAVVIDADRLDLSQLKAITGGFLPGYAPEHSEAFSEWLDGYRARTTFDLSKAVLREVTRARTVGDWTTTEQAARACLAVAPLNEEATLALAEMLAIGGAKSQAVKLLDRYLNEIGETSRELRLPAMVLKRRISEHRPEAYVSRDISPFVGRDSEMRVLREHLERARGGSNECVAVIGDAGIGKSRLVKEFSTAATLDGAAVAATTSLPHDVHRPFGAFSDLLPRLLAMRGALGCLPESMRALERLTKAPVVDTGSFADTVRDSDALCDSLIQAILDLVDAIAGEQLLVLAVEDVHWLDAMSLRVLGYLLSPHRTRRLLVLVTSRRQTPIAEISRYADSVRLLEIKGLASEAIGRLAAAFSTQTEIPLDAEMTVWLEDTSTGNPLFLESLLAYYARTRERFAISPTLSNLLSRRVELLSPHAATTLQVCALLGKYATLDTLMAALQLSRSDLIRAVGELESARLLKSDEGNIRPAHALIADVAQGRLSPIERRLAHQCVALALETLLTPSRSVDVVWECAEHWVAAHDATRALDALRRCATQALEIGRPGEAAQVLARALKLDVNAKDRQLIGRQMVLAADAAGETSLVFQGYEALGGRDTTREHDDLEFAHFRACSRSRIDAGEREDDLFACITATDASANHRVRAAIAVTQYADVQGNRRLAERAVRAVPTDVLRSADTTVHLEFLLVGHTVLGEWDQGAAVARELLSVIRARSSPFRGQLGLNVGVALFRAGCRSEATEAVRFWHAEAVAAGNRRVARSAAFFLAEFLINSDDEQLAAEWRGRVQRSPQDGHDLGETTFFLMQALETSDVRTAREQFDRLDSIGFFFGSPERLRWQDVLGIRLYQVETGLSAPESDVERLIRRDAMTPAMVDVRDVEIHVICRGLLLSGRRSEAREFSDEYFTSGRITRSPLPKWLLDLRRELSTT